MKRLSNLAGNAQKAAATIRDVAAQAGVSTATVSRVLSSEGAVAPEVRERVIKAVKALDYHPNRLARGLRAKKRRLIGVVIPDLLNPFFTGVVQGVESVLCREGYTLLLGHSDGSTEREYSHFSIFRGEGAAGLIFAPANNPDTNYSCLRDWNFPVVAVDRSPNGLSVDLVGATNRDGAWHATHHFIELGYRSIALINGPPDYDVSHERLTGFRDACSQIDRKHLDILVVHGDFRQASGRLAMLELLKQPQRPRAVLVANNLMTLGALQAIYEQGLRIPEDLAIIGFDDMPWASSLNPPLTAVAQPAEEIGRTAAELLMERLKDPARPCREIVLRTSLVVRGSCGASNVLNKPPILNPPNPIEKSIV